MKGRWTPADATQSINGMASLSGFSVHLTTHAKAQMRDRRLIVGDLLHLLRRGFVYDDPEPATRGGLWKFKVEGVTPNSDGRTVAAIVIPGPDGTLKIVTMMWKDGR